MEKEPITIKGLEKLKKEKGLDKKKQAVMEELKKQIEALDPDAKLVTDGTDELDQDKDIIALKKQLEDIKNKKYCWHKSKYSEQKIRANI